MSMPSAVLGFKSFMEAARGLPRAIARSLNPATPTDAAILESQLDIVHTSIRWLDFALPVTAAAVMLTVYNNGIAAMPMGAFFVVLVLTCLLNEYLLGRKTPVFEGEIQHAKWRARTVSISAVMLVTVWCMTVLSMYHPEIIANRIFIVLVLACTVGSLSSMFATHTASAAGTMLVMIASLFAILIRNGFSGRFSLIPIGAVYVLFVINQVRGLHERFAQGRRLELDHEKLITSLREANEESRAAQEQAISASKAKSEFLANMSHELRTPLNAIIGFSEVMREQMFGPLGDARYRDYTRLIHSAGAHLLGLINDVLDMSKIEAGKWELNPESFDVKLVIGECADLMRERAEAAGIDLATELPDHALPVFADRRAVNQILLNLLSNAVKFTLPGGRVCVKASTRDGVVSLAVADNGMGIPERDLPRLGQPFVQVRNQPGGNHAGTGLGLALVRAFTEQHHGAMRIESLQGVGTTVTIDIPEHADIAAAA